MSDNVITLTPAVRSKFKRTQCQHNVVSIDPSTHACSCEKCGDPVSASWFLLKLAERWDTYERQFAASERARKELDAYKPWLRAVKVLEHIWRGKMLPTCPHCRKPIEAEALSKGWKVRKERT